MNGVEGRGQQGWVPRQSLWSPKSFLPSAVEGAASVPSTGLDALLEFSN